MRDDRQTLLDMLEAVSSIEKYASKGQELFFNNELIRIWIAHHLQGRYIRGTSCSRIARAF